MAISRKAGTGACEIARAIGQRLGWEVLDKSLRERVARRYHSSNDALKLVDETAPSWVYDVLGAWMRSGAGAARALRQPVDAGGLPCGAAGQDRVRRPGGRLPLAPASRTVGANGSLRRNTGCTDIMQSQTLERRAARQVMDRVDRDRALFVIAFSITARTIRTFTTW